MPPFNKMFVMLPVMLAARKLDGEDPSTVYMVRVAYAAVQTLCVLVVLWTFLKARTLQNNSTIVYVPAAAQVSVSLSVCLCVFLSLVVVYYWTHHTTPTTIYFMVSHLPTRMPRKSTRKLSTDNTSTPRRALSWRAHCLAWHSLAVRVAYVCWGVCVVAAMLGH